MRDLFGTLLAGGEAAIEKLVADQLNENVELEFKTKSDPTNGQFNNDDKKNLAKELSAFSNSMGGLLIWEVVAEKDADGIDRAVRTARISEIDRFKADTLSLLGELLVPKNEDIHVEAAHSADGSGAGYLIVYVGRSERRPHRSEARNQKQYFKRAGDSSYPMEHFDIEDAFNRVAAPELSIQWEVERRDHIRKEWPWRVLLFLSNSSRRSARFPYLDLSNVLGGRVAQHNLAVQLIHGLPAKQVGRWITFAGGSDDVVHPGQKLLMTAIQFYLVQTRENEWQRSTQAPISFEYRFGALDCRMRQGHMVIEGADLDAALINNGIDIVND